MNRDEFAILLARRSKTTKVALTQDEARQTIDLMVDILSETLSKPDGYVSFKGFGTLSVDRRIRRGRAGQLQIGNTQETKQASRIAHYIRFKPSVVLKDKLKLNIFASKYTED
ncbi:MAG: hypothetical protein Crog4KO_34890 [Crocinitomicaceae bacterium]